MAKAHLTAQRLRQLLRYDPLTGLFSWLVEVRPLRPIPAGTVAGHRNGKGYLAIRVDGREYKAHRLAVLWMSGAWPADQVDHINGCRHANMWKNLRCVTGQVNCQNQRKAQSSSTHGLLGVSRRHNYDGPLPWVAQIRANGVKRHLGYFATPEEAHQAYLSAKRQLHPGNTL